MILYSLYMYIYNPQNIGIRYIPHLGTAYLHKTSRCQFENTQFQGSPDLNYPRKCSGNNIHNPFISHLNAFSAVNKFSWESWRSTRFTYNAGTRPPPMQPQSGII